MYKILSANCKGCIYYASFTDSCDYIMVTGKQRPCLAGEQCTIRKKGQKIIAQHPMYFDHFGMPFGEFELSRLRRSVARFADGGSRCIFQGKPLI